MWAMVLCGLSYGGRVFVYDGSPFVPEPTVTLRLASMLKSVHRSIRGMGYRADIIVCRFSALPPNFCRI